LDKLTPEALYLQLGRLIAEMPDLSVPGPISDETNRWLGRAAALVEKAGIGVDHLQFQVAAQNLDGVIRARNAQTIKSLVFTALARAELAAPASVQGAFIPAGGEFDAFVAFGKVLATATADLLIVDPYADEKALTDFAIQARAGVTIRVLADQARHKPSLKPAADRWRKQFAAERPLELRLAAPKSLHDRLIFADRQNVWTFGQSLNAIAARAHTSINRVDPETAAMKVVAFEAIWAEAASL
jgi:hypothetical protein